MSRHVLEPYTAGREVAVGWDRPLGTFFAQVFDTTKDEDDQAYELLWIGFYPGEVPEPQDVCEAVRPWARVPSDLLDLLAADRRREGFRG